MKSARWLCLLLATLACTTFNDFITLPGPEDLATDAVGPTQTAPAGTPPGTPLTPPPPTPAPSATPLTPPGAMPFTLDEADDAQRAMRPDYAADVERFPDATRYVIDLAVTFNADGSATLIGRELIRYTNREAEALTELYLMLWPNAPNQYLGSLTLGAVTVDRQPVEPVLEYDGLAARLPLTDPLAPGASLDLKVNFQAQARPGLENGARFGLTHGVLIAPTFYPLIPRRVDGAWQIEPPPTGGDTTNSDTAFYAWRVTGPFDAVMAASGVVIDEGNTRTTHTQTLLTGPMRDLALVMGDLVLEQSGADGVLLNAYLLPEHADLAAEVLQQAGRQIETLQDAVGPYPFVELDIVDAPGAFGGIEYPGLVLVGIIDSNLAFEAANVHEVGHQWFYSLIGDDQLLEPWLDEAAASYTEVLYYERTQGAGAAQEMINNAWTYLSYADDPTLPIGRPVAGYGDDYGPIVYGKGALFFDALRRQLGDDVFFDFLHAYYDRYAYGFATTAGFQATAEETCACDLSALFSLWVYDGGPVEQP